MVPVHVQLATGQAFLRKVSFRYHDLKVCFAFSTLFLTRELPVPIIRPPIIIFTANFTTSFIFFQFCIVI